MSSTHGHCLCGAVRFGYDPAGLRWTGFCHCESCRRATAAPVTAILAVRDSAWRWMGEAPKLFRSSEGVRRYFCGTCGTPIAYASAHQPGETRFYAATLDDPADFLPETVLHGDEALPWAPCQAPKTRQSPA
jgi:hypothetical protein